MSNTKKGGTIQRLAKQALEAQGARVELARASVIWIKNKAKPFLPARPISTAVDIFGIWDAIAVWDQDHRSFYQMTVVDGVSARRKKIVESGFPVSPNDAILAFVGGRGRHFRVYRGPTFAEWDGETLEIPRDRKPRTKEAACDN